MRSILLSLAVAAASTVADESPAPKSAAISAEQSIKSLAVAPGLRVDLWASEPLLRDPVALAFDNSGRAYVAETGRRRSSMQDIRKNEEWIVENLALRSVEDRIAFLKRKLAPELKLRPNTIDHQDFNKDGQFDWRDLEFESEIIRVIEDSDGDGRADKSRVFAEGFNSLATGIGAGVALGPDGNLYYTCAPDLWLIKPDGTKQRLGTGYGVHLVFSGHDMHGLRIGPDGRIYFSIGDTGASVVGGDGKKIECPDSGAIFRCWPDGSGLELHAWGLRNPQHLAFNDVGDLFTVDNNADGGDKARLLHIIEGADYGWRIGHQFMPKLGVWSGEGWWHLNVAETNAAILPPIAHIGHGPAGFSFYPGTGLPERYAGHFFMADFPGGVRAFKLKQKGATYELDGFAPDAPVLQNNSGSEMTAKLLWNLDPSDVQFAPGGGVYVLDWTKGWEKTGRGRIFHVHDPVTDQSEIVRETKRLLAEDFSKLEADKLIALLGHADQRVRMKAQWALAVPQFLGPLQQCIVRSGERIQRMHAMWALAQIAHREPQHAGTLLSLSKDEDPELRAQWARCAGEIRAEFHVDVLLSLIGDESPRVRFAAIQSLARLKGQSVSDRLFQQLRQVKEMDPCMRHAVSRALAASADSDALSVLSEHPDSRVRLVALLALRKKGSGEIASFLKDPDPLIQLEAVRAIHDTPIPEAFDALAKLAGTKELAGIGVVPGPDGKPTGISEKQFSQAEALARRVFNANYRLGTAEAAARLVKIASLPTNPGEAFGGHFAAELLAKWNADNGVDAVTGFHRSLPPDRAKQPLGKEQKDWLIAGGLLRATPRIRSQLAVAAGNFGMKEAAPTLLSLVKGHDGMSGDTSAAALRALDTLDTPELAEALKFALESKDAKLLEAARRISINRTPGLALEGIVKVLKKGTPAEQRQAIDALGHLAQSGADEQIGVLLYKMKTGALPATLHLDTLEAAARRDDPAVKTLLREWEKLRKSDDPLARWRECLEGGDANVGRKLFVEKAEAGCLRCHAINKLGGDVGPDLAGFGAKHDRTYLLRAIVTPDAEIAPGYENVLVTLNDGNAIAGILAAEDAATLTLKNVADGKPQAVKKSDIKERSKLPSAMIPGLGEVLTKRELRDIVEYLATLK